VADINRTARRGATVDGDSGEKAGGDGQRFLRRGKADARDRCGVRASRRSSVSARCEPRFEPITACISSTMATRAVLRMARPPALVARRQSDSGVVARICGDRLTIAARAEAGVSPVLSPTRMRLAVASSPLAERWARMPASGACRLRSMSLLSALSGETWNRRVSSGSGPVSASHTRSSIAQRNAASVLPEPVGAAMRVCCPSLICGHACCWTGLGASKALSAPNCRVELLENRRQLTLSHGLAGANDAAGSVMWLARWCALGGFPATDGILRVWHGGERLRGYWPPSGQAPSIVCP